MNLESFGEDKNQRRFSKIAASVFNTSPVDILEHKLLVQPGYVANEKGLIDIYSYKNLVGDKGYSFTRGRLFIIGSLDTGWFILSSQKQEGSMERRTFGRACRAMDVILSSDRMIKDSAPTLELHDQLSQYQ